MENQPGSFSMGEALCRLLNFLGQSSSRNIHILEHWYKVWQTESVPWMIWGVKTSHLLQIHNGGLLFALINSIKNKIKYYFNIKCADFYSPFMSFYSKHLISSQ
jgi:hypothetical protein